MVQFQELKITPDGKKLIIDVSVKDSKYYTNVYLDKILIDNQDSFLESGPSSSAIIFPIIQDGYKLVEVVDDDFTAETETYYTYKGTLEEGVYYDFSKVTIEDTFEGTPIVLDFIGQDYSFDYDSGDLKGRTFIFKDGDLVESPLKIKTIRMEINYTELLYNLNQDLLFVYVKIKGTPSIDTPCGMDNITTLGVVSNLYPLYQHAFSYIKELSNTCSIPKNFINYILQYKAFELAVKTGHYTKAIKYWKKFFMGIKDSVITSNCGCYGQGT